MKMITKYRCEDGSEFGHIDMAIKHEYLMSMQRHGFSTESSLKIFDKIDDIKRLIDIHNHAIEQIKLDRTV